MPKHVTIGQIIKATFIVEIQDDADPQEYADRIEVIMRSDREAEAVEEACVEESRQEVLDSTISPGRRVVSGEPGHNELLLQTPLWDALVARGKKEIDARCAGERIAWFGEALVKVQIGEVVQQVLPGTTHALLDLAKEQPELAEDEPPCMANYVEEWQQQEAKVDAASLIYCNAQHRLEKELEAYLADLFPNEPSM